MIITISLYLPKRGQIIPPFLILFMIYDFRTVFALQLIHIADFLHLLKELHLK